MFDNPAISVGELCRLLKAAVEDAFPDRLRVSGEVSGCRQYPSGHVYFKLKDADGLVNCVVWRSTAMSLDVAVPIPDGTAVEVTGRVSIYKDRSEYQLVVDAIVPVGRGELYRKFELLKEKLAREGLFDESRKRPIPEFVRGVAVVTSRGGAALQDFLTTCRRRGGHVAVTLVHAPVQGDAAIKPLARAIRYAGTLPVDVVVVTRGGGSIEDLWAFNTEPVARAIARCAKPVISAVGHEVDFTIADFVADKRAPTPTAAAEMITPDRAKLLEQLSELERRSRRALGRVAADARRRVGTVIDDLVEAADAFVGARAQAVDDFEGRLLAADPRRRTREMAFRIAAARQRIGVAAAAVLSRAADRMRSAAERQGLEFAKAIAVRYNAVDVAAARLAALGPSATLGRGYAIVFDRRGAPLTDSSATTAGEALDIALAHGRVSARVTDTHAPDE